jgi:histidine triad (HIT) family protein
VEGNEKSFTVFEDKKFIVFLDIRPLFLGHCLVAPKKHFPTINDLPDNHIKSYFQLIQKISQAIELSELGTGSFIAINNKISQSIPHLHTHVVPRKYKDGLKGFFWPRLHKPDDKEMLRIQKLLQKICKANFDL